MKNIIKTILIFLLLGISLTINSQSSNIEIHELRNILYGRHGNSYDYTITQNGENLSDLQFAKITNDKKMINRIEWDINKPQRIRTTGKVVFVTGLIAIIAPSIKLAVKGRSENYWENAVIFTGVITSTFGGVGMMRYKDIYYNLPDHYYHIEEARKRAEKYNFNNK